MSFLYLLDTDSLSFQVYHHKNYMMPGQTPITALDNHNQTNIYHKLRKRGKPNPFSELMC